MPHKLKIVSIASETFPFSKSGGLADVVGSLPKALYKLGHDIIAITPYYNQFIDFSKYKLDLVYQGLSINLDNKNTLKVSYYLGYLDNQIPIYFIRQDKFFNHKRLYGYPDENKRFYFFNVAALKLIELLNFSPDIIHCHDWHTGLIPELIKKRPADWPSLKQTKTVFTIHNLTFQLGHDWWHIPEEEKDFGHKNLPKFDDPKIEYVNFAKRAIINADIINTVSPQYAEEILTKDFGQDLHHILFNNKHKLYGIINCIDEKEFNPATDPGLTKNFNYDSVNLKKVNKEAIQSFFNLPVKDVPLLGMTSRLVEQKGFELLNRILETLMSLDLQILIMGDGDKKYISFLNKMQRKFPKKLAYKAFDQKWETSIYAGADMLLLPSRFEPCGLNQLYALRYGCIPIVHRIGGLADTVTEFHAQKFTGNGFVFRRYHSDYLLMAIIRALTVCQFSEVWHKLIVKGMKQSSFWITSAKKYVTLFRKAIKK